MIDTVKLKHFYQSLKCENFRNNFQQIKFGKKPIWVLNSKDRNIPNLTMLQAPNGVWHLSAEVSLPKLIFGHNAKLPNQQDVKNGLSLICKYTELHTGLSFDTNTARVVRADFLLIFYVICVVFAHITLYIH